MKRKIISLLLCLVMALSLIPTVAFGYSKSDAEQRYEKVSSFDHIDVRVDATFTYETMTDGALTDTVTKTATISNPKITLYDKDDNLKKEKSFSTSPKYEWRWTRIEVLKTDKIAVTCDITVDGQTMRGKTFTFAGKDDFVQAILNCDGHQGLDFNISGSDVHNILSDGKLTIVKNLNQAFNTAQTFSFNVTKVGDNTFTDTITVTVPAGATTAQVTTDAKYAYGTYTVTEANAAIDGYDWTAPAAQPFTIDATHLDESLTFTNTYEKNAPATTSVTVTKEWVDDNNSFNTRPDSVTVNLLKDGKETGKTLTLTKDNWSGSFTDVFAGGNYTVSEVPVPGYTSQVIEPGKPVVTVGALTKVPNCNFTTFDTEGANLVIAKLTENDGYVVWTKTPLTNDQKDTLLVQVKAACNIPDSKTVDFISGENVTHTSNGETATFADGTLSFTKTKMWSMFWYGNVTESQSNNGFTIVNTLNIKEGELVPATLTIKKVDSNDNTKPLSGATFTLTNADGRLVGGKALVTDENGTCTFTDLPEGYYTLAETKAPDGYKQTNQTWTIVVVKDEEPSIVLNEDKTAFQKVYDCTVSNLVGNESVPLTNGLMTITNDKEPEFYTVTLPIQKIVDKKVGSDNPGETKFTFVATKYDEQTEKTTQYGLGTITTKGVGTYNGTLKIEVPANLFTDGNDSILLQVSEVKGTDSKWSYDKTVYRVLIYVQDSEVKYIVNPQIALRATADQEQKPTTLTFTNVYSSKYTPTPKPTTPAKPVTSVKTGDMGVALYAGLAILSMTGSAGVILRRRKNDK